MVRWIIFAHKYYITFIWGFPANIRYDWTNITYASCVLLILPLNKYGVKKIIFNGIGLKSVSVNASQV